MGLMPSPYQNKSLKAVKTITKKGQQVQITEFEPMVTASWFYLERNGKLEKIIRATILSEKRL
jgi:hypothetical protein